MTPCRMFVPNSRLLQVPQYATDSSWTFWLHVMTDASARLNTNRQSVLNSPRDFSSPKLARTFPVLTPIMPRPFVSSNAPTSSSASPNAIRFVNFRSSVWAYASFALRALRVSAGASDNRGLQPECRVWKKRCLPSATAALLWPVVRYGKRLYHLRRWGRGQPIKVFFDLFSKLFSITT
jgi:hypothetical protein